MAALKSALYTSLHVTKNLADERDLGGHAFYIPIDHTVGADANGDTVDACVLRKGDMVVGIDVANSALGASTTLAVGDSGSATRFMAATSVTSAGKFSGLLSAGQNYRVTADTVVILTWGGANPTAAGTVKGGLWVVKAQG
jgi:hypothetical protein